MRRALIAAALIAASPAFAASKIAVSKNESVALALDEVHTLTFRAGGEQGDLIVRRWLPEDGRAFGTPS